MWKCNRDALWLGGDGEEGELVLADAELDFVSGKGHAVDAVGVVVVLRARVVG